MSTVLNPHGGRVGSRSGGPARGGIAACIVALIGVASGGQETAPKAAASKFSAPKEEAPRAVAPTFAKDVAPILQAKCQNCHRRHEAGPFALETYEQARKRAWDIVAVVEGGSMPPWKPEHGVGPKLKHDLSLTPAEIATLGDWADAGAPLGNPKDMPPPPRFAEGWKQGPPDLELVPAEEFSIPASGPDLYRCFVLPTNLARDTYVTMIDFRPGNPRVVHHMQLFVDTTEAARQRDKEEKGPGYTSFSGPGIPVFEMMGFWNAGQEPLPLPPGVGLHLPRQADVILQVHYHPSGKPEVDRTRVGLYLARGPIKQALHWNGAQNQEFSLPAGEPRIEVRASWNIPCDVEAIAVSPHMHMLGRDMRISVTYPNQGRTIDLISIPD